MGSALGRVAAKKEHDLCPDGRYLKFILQTYIVINDSKKQDVFCTICCEEALSDVMENSEIIQCLDKGSHFACAKVMCYVTSKKHFT